MTSAGVEILAREGVTSGVWGEKMALFTRFSRVIFV